VWAIRRLEVYGLQTKDVHRPHAARLLTDSSVDGLSGTVRFEWAALDAWFEEDERVLNFAHLLSSDTVTECPYKGTTSAYWSVRLGETVYPDLVWCYDFPTRALFPIAAWSRSTTRRSTPSSTVGC
jgi:hypothetical protein